MYLIFNNMCEYILCRGIATAMQEEKRKEKKEEGNNFVFFSDEKKQNWASACH